MGLNIPSSTLLNFGDIKLQEIIEPSQKFLSVPKIGIMYICSSFFGVHTVIHSCCIVQRAERARHTLIIVNHNEGRAKGREEERQI